MRYTGEEKETLRDRLQVLGFDDVRFTNLEPIENKRLHEWVELGYHADMAWLKNSIEKRLNPELVLEGACSAVMLGINYLPPEAEKARSQNRWSKYSLHIDYHDTVLEGLKAAGALLENFYQLGPRDYRYYVDTGPVMERGWAAASGMGWQGKNGMLISKKHGNWLLLATILVKMDIEPDPPLKKNTSVSEKRTELALLCGKCERCIQACPTDAIVKPGILDANRCISYQTIENKGVIPREFREAIGSRIFGCDICLDICPWNRFAQSGKLLLLSARYDMADMDLVDILKMDMETFRAFYRKTPIKRLKLRGLLRNACIVAGNLFASDEWWVSRQLNVNRQTYLEKITEALIALASYEEAMVRPHAVWALYRLFGDEAAGMLKAARESEGDEATLQEYSYWDQAKKQRHLSLRLD